MTILIADDHTIVRQGVKMLLTEAYPLAQITDVSDSASVIQEAAAGQWDVIICDISMPPGDSGLEAIKHIKEHSPRTPVIILSMHAPDQYALRAIKAGAMGYLTKGVATLELVTAVNKVMSGKKYLSQDVAYILADAVEQGDHDSSTEQLSNRELEVFKLLASGRCVTDIARDLSLSNNTISTFRLRIFEKMGFRNNLELIRYAVNNKFIS
jgi:two-component system invasion response regulator UvrY